MVRPFCDANDGYYTYRVGDEFPRSGVTVSPSRIEQLSTVGNIHGSVFIEECIEDIFSEAKKGDEGNKSGSNLSDSSKAKGKQRKGQKKHARTDS